MAIYKYQSCIDSLRPGDRIRESWIDDSWQDWIVVLVDGRLWVEFYGDSYGERQSPLRFPLSNFSFFAVNKVFRVSGV